MSNKGLFIAASFLLISTAFTWKVLTNWKIGKDYAISFDSEDASGIFTSFSGQIIFDPAKLDQSKFDVQIPVESIDTDNFLKNRHAKSEKWFDAATYPFITYTSNLIQKTRTGYMVKGTLTIRGISKPVTIPFKFSGNGASGFFDGFFSINRMDYNIGKAGAIADEIKIKIKVPVSR